MRTRHSHSHRGPCAPAQTLACLAARVHVHQAASLQAPPSTGQKSEKDAYIHDTHVYIGRTLENVRSAAAFRLTAAVAAGLSVWCTVGVSDENSPSARPSGRSSSLARSPDNPSYPWIVRSSARRRDSWPGLSHAHHPEQSVHTYTQRVHRAPGEDLECASRHTMNH